MKEPHGIRILFAFILLIVSSTFGVWSSLVHIEMVDKLNERLPADQRFDVFWWGPFKHQRFREEYERQFPDDPLKRRLWLFAVMMFASFIAIALDLGPFWCFNCPTR